MRSEDTMLELILSTARADERIRVVMLNGSRANPNAPRDFFQDFDVVYFVTEMESFLAEPRWIGRFGEMMILQLPDEMEDAPAGGGGSYTYLMQFMDGNRIDLTLFPIHALAQMEKDSQSIVLLDKDGLFPPLPPPADTDTLPKPATAKQFADCCNEFWWVNPYVAKGLWRREIPYAKSMHEAFVRPQLMKMLTWYVGAAWGYTANPGKLSKYLQRFLPAEMWQLLLQTYSDVDIERSWDALLAAGALFRMAALRVAQEQGFDYPIADDQRVSAHLLHVRALPRDAKTMYEDRS